MGKRSRKRGVPERSGAGSVSASSTTRAERDEARRRRAEAMRRGEQESPRAARRRASGKTSFEDRPPAPWGSFPLVEIVVLIALILLVASFFVGGSRRGPMLLGGLALGSLPRALASARSPASSLRSASTSAASARTARYWRARWPQRRSRLAISSRAVVASRSR